MLRCRGLSVAFGDVVALEHASLDVPSGATTVLMGPSGCGKSTLLRVIAGLVQPSAGAVDWNGEDIGAVATHERGFGLMFQDYALFPHRNVGENVGFGLRMAGLSATEVERRVTDVLALVGLAGAAARPVSVLSGGEQQRVALARSLAPAPRLLMLDEPIGALDRDLRAQLMPEMRHLFRDLGLTVLYVTHDVDEAFALADHIAVMRAGAVVRAGTPESLWRDPRSQFVARFMGRETVVGAEEATRLADRHLGGGAGTPIVVPPDALEIAADPAGTGSVTGRVFMGEMYRVTLDIAGVTLTALVHEPLDIGDRVRVSIDPARIVALDE